MEDKTKMRVKGSTLVILAAFSWNKRCNIQGSLQRRRNPNVRAGHEVSYSIDTFVGIQPGGGRLRRYALQGSSLKYCL